MTIAEVLAHPKVKGVCIGSCVRSRQKLEEFGHAHLEGDPYAGFICVASLAQFRKGIGDLPAASTLPHELAHLVSNQYRGRAFHEAARHLGVAEEAQRYHPAYKRRKRGP